MRLDTASRVDALAELVAGGDVVVLSGAGLSTESGIPDYRGPSGASRRRPPMTYRAFVDDPVARRRYWARSHLGWRHLSSVGPNAGHRAVAALEHSGVLVGTITQNVDGLHQRAGSHGVLDLHGRLDRVVCLDCRAVVSREEVAARMSAANASWDAEATALNPDGDADVPDGQLDGFVVVACERCGGTLKPDVVYFGENVPVARVATANDWVDRARAVLVLGSSLTVFSGRRFVLRAAREGKAVAIVNDGPTRCDDLAGIRLHGRLGATLTRLADAIGSGAGL